MLILENKRQHHQTRFLEVSPTKLIVVNNLDGSSLEDLMDQWLPLTDYATKYKVSVSTLRRRIKADDIKFQFQDGKYFISDQPISTLSKNSPSLGFSVHEKVERADSEVEFDEIRIGPTPSPSNDFLENVRKTSSTKLPQIKNEMGMLNRNKANSNGSGELTLAKPVNIEDEYYFRSQGATRSNGITSEFDLVSNNDIHQEQAPRSKSSQLSSSQQEYQNPGLKEFSEKVSKIGNNEPILTAANKLLAELKKAYTQILQEKEEQIMTLKEEVSDLKTLVKVLESENSRLKNLNNF